MMVSLRSRAKLATAGLFAIGIVHAIAAGTSVWMLRLLSKLAAGEDVPPSDVESVLRFSDQLEVAYWVGLVVAATTFLVWFDRAYKNLSAFGPTLSSQGGGAVVAWFIPLVNLVRPYQIAKDIWTGSVRASEDGSARPGVGVITTWWLFWIVSGVLGHFLLRGEPQTFDGAISFQYQAIVVNGLRVVAAALAAVVVKRITDRQEAAIARARVVD